MGQTLSESPYFRFCKANDRKIINVRSFSTERIGLRCHMRSTFEERVFPTKITMLRLFDVFALVWDMLFTVF